MVMSTHNGMPKTTYPTISYAATLHVNHWTSRSRGVGPSDVEGLRGRPSDVEGSRGRDIEGLEAPGT